MKVTVVGAGAVGATCADNIARKELASELVILDIKEGFAEGKAQDIQQTAALLGFDTRITGTTGDYSKTAGSAVVVISNPMDTMTYLALQSTGLPKNRIIGMGGTLDSARFKYQLSQTLCCSAGDLNAVVVGGHGDTTMIPLIRLATWNSVPVTKFLTKEQQDKIVADTMVGGATLTKLLGTSAWYAPGAAGAAVVEAIVRDEKKLFTACVYLDGEYGQKDICMGVPVVIGKGGWEKIIDFELDEAEKAAFAKSADAVRNMNDVLKTL